MEIAIRVNKNACYQLMLGIQDKILNICILMYFYKHVIFCLFSSSLQLSKCHAKGLEVIVTKCHNFCCNFNRFFIFALLLVASANVFVATSAYNMCRCTRFDSPVVTSVLNYIFEQRTKHTNIQVEIDVN